MMGFSSVILSQVPDGFTIVQTHYDDITWYEARENWSGVLCAIYNGGKKGIGFKDVLSITYSHGYFFYKQSSSRGGVYYNVYDIEGRSVQLCSTNMISGYEVIDDKLYMYHYCGVYDENRNKVGEEFIIGAQGERLLKTEITGKYGIRDIKTNEEILAPEFQDCGYLGSNLFKFKMNGYWGVMNKQGKIIIPLSRQYMQIDYSRTLKTFTFVKEGGYKGECNANGTQTSIAKVQQPKPQQQVQQPKQETKPQQPKQETVTPTPQPQSQPRQLQPFQVWKQCHSCQGSGQCHTCLGLGHSLTNPDIRCIICNGTGRCTQCGGQGGHNEVEYH